VSADNFAVCPRCLGRAQQAHEEQTEQTQEAYGKVPAPEYEEMRRHDLESAPNPENFLTFREDYEFFGADMGLVVAHYKGECHVCGLSTELRAEKRFFEPWVREGVTVT
jgi:hypothetical protein